MGLVKCVVPGCEDRTSPRHRIPVLDQELYEEWLERIGNEELKCLDPQFVGSNKRICSVHFSSHCRIPNSTKLKNRSLPTLNLPGFKLEPSLENSILKYSDVKTPYNGFISDLKPDTVDYRKNKLQSFTSSSSLKVKCHGIKNSCQRYKQYTEPMLKVDEQICGGCCLTIDTLQELFPCMSQSLMNEIVPEKQDQRKLKGEKLIHSPRPAITSLNSFRQKERRSLQSLQGSANCWRRVAGQLPPRSEPTGPTYKGERCEVPTNIDFTYLIKIDSSLPDDSLFSPSIDDTCAPILGTSNFATVTSDISQSSLYEGFEELSNSFPTVDLEELVRERCKSLLPETPSANSLCH